MLKKIINYFDKLEDKTRRKLSHKPLLYAFLGGVGVVLFWRGIWHMTDFVMARLFLITSSNNTLDLGQMPWWDGVSSLVVGSILLLITGAFVSNLIGNEIIISGIKGEKKIAEKTEAEIIKEMEETAKIKHQIKEISETLLNIKKFFPKKKK